jgi:hypothetical protein
MQPKVEVTVSFTEKVPLDAKTWLKLVLVVVKLSLAIHVETSVAAFAKVELLTKTTASVGFLQGTSKI